MPVNENLRDSPRLRIIREYFRSFFPPTEYQYIARPDSDQYLTTDGEHLEGAEALRYTEYFKLEIDKDLLIMSPRPKHAIK